MDAEPAGLGEPTSDFVSLPRDRSRRTPARPGVWIRSRADLLNSSLDWLGERVVLFRIGNLVFVTFGMFAALGAFSATALLAVILLGQGLGSGAFLSFTLFGSAAVVAASWLFGQILDYRPLLSDPLAALRRPVFVSWGGIAALPVVVLVFSQLSGASELMLADALARTSLIGLALGRFGCLSYGCCFGRPTDGPVAIRYRNPLSKAVRMGGMQHIRLHPAALYEAGMNLVILLLVNLAAGLGAPLGVPSALALILYGLCRFLVEFVRDQSGREAIGGWATNHLISLLMVVVGGLLLISVLDIAAPPLPVAWGVGFESARVLLPGMLPGALVVFLGFSTHRRSVGAW